nr:A-kinase anchor protein 14 [Nomia melanderi]
MIFDNVRSVFTNYPEINDRYLYACYSTINKFCERCVNKAFESALEIIANMGAITYDDFSGKYMRQMGYFGNKWLTCGNFTIQGGLNSIIKEMESWNALPLLKEWMFHATFIGLHCRRGTEFYTYEVLWSIPTPAYPEPLVTVSVFFHISTNSNYPSHYPIDILYQFEGHQFLHRLNMIFRPKWLYDVLDMKSMMSQSFDF